MGDGGEWAYSGGAEGEFGGHREVGLAEPWYILIIKVRP